MLCVVEHNLSVKIGENLFLIKVCLFFHPQNAQNLKASHVLFSEQGVSQGLHKRRKRKQIIGISCTQSIKRYDFWFKTPICVILSFFSYKMTAL